MSFWNSDLGELTGTADHAFARQIRIIPDGTTALAKILKFTNEDNNGKQYFNIEWELLSGDFKNQRVYQKIHAFDADPKKRHRALNMLMYVYKLFNLKPASSHAPTDQDLLVFTGKTAGIKIQETAPNENGKQYNWVSEVHPPENFVSETGIKLEIVHTPSHNIESAFSRNPKGQNMSLTDDIPF